MELNRLSVALRDWLNRSGWNFQSYRKFLELLPEYDVDLVVDVGANVGQFGAELRRMGYVGNIVSFEPCVGPYRELEKLANRDPNWSCVHAAAGDEVKERETIRLYSDSRFSSMNELKSLSMDYTEEEIRVTRLDDYLPNKVEFSNAKRPFLKIDTQGFDEQVLLGAAGVLDRFCGVQLECSLSPLYDNQWTIEAAITYMRSKGLVPWVIKRGFIQKNREYEIDMLFFREDVMTAGT